jgi:SYP6 family syntaxin
MIDEIDRSIDAAEKNPTRFLLTQADISERRKWVMQSRRQVEAISDGNLPNLPAKSQKVNGVDAKLANAVEDENSDFIRSEGERQQLLMAQQDQELDVLNQHVVRIGELGREMGQELNSQGQLLDDLGEEMEGTQTRLAAAQKKVQYVLDRAGTKGQLLIIAFLVVVLVVLIFLAIA